MASLEQEVKHPIVVMGDHMYKAVWDPCLGNHSTAKYERNNPDYKHTVAVLPVDLKMTVRHLLKEISEQCCLFMLHGGAGDARQSSLVVRHATACSNQTSTVYVHCPKTNHKV